MTDAETRAPFDPSDPTDAMSEMFRRQITDMALDAYKATIYREMDTTQQLECFIAGALTGLVGVCLASCKTEGADAVMEYLASCLPVAREMAESIADENGRPVINRHDAVSEPTKRGKMTKKINCKYCGMGHAPKADGNHWIVKSIVPAKITIAECAYHKAGAVSPIQMPARSPQVTKND